MAWCGADRTFRRLVRLTSLLALAAAAPETPLVLPVSPTCITSSFGMRTLPHGPFRISFHYGIDLRAPLGTPVRAVAAGRILRIDRMGAGGLEVRVRHPGFDALYAHLGRLTPALLRGKRTLAAGEQLGVVGESGLTFGPHLYFELWRNGRRVDPAPYLHVPLCP